MKESLVTKRGLDEWQALSTCPNENVDSVDNNVEAASNCMFPLISKPS